MATTLWLWRSSGSCNGILDLLWLSWNTQVSMHVCSKLRGTLKCNSKELFSCYNKWRGWGEAGFKEGNIQLKKDQIKAWRGRDLFPEGLWENPLIMELNKQQVSISPSIGEIIAQNGKYPSTEGRFWLFYPSQRIPIKHLLATCSSGRQHTYWIFQTFFPR